MKATVTDPVNDEVEAQHGEFFDLWHQIGSDLFTAMVKAKASGKPDCWINTSVTIDGKSYAHHRTISVD